MENETSTTQHLHQLSARSFEEKLLAAGLILILVTTLLGNLVVVIVFCTHKPLQKVINIFLVSLALSDMLVGAVNLPIWIVIILCNFDGISAVSTHKVIDNFTAFHNISCESIWGEFNISTGP